MMRKVETILRRLEALEDEGEPPLVLVWREYGQTAEQAVAERFGPSGPGLARVHVLAWADNPVNGDWPEGVPR